MSGLTPKQLHVFQFIEQFIAANQYGPSIRDICKGCSIKSNGEVHKIVSSLRDRGYITYRPLTPHSIAILFNKNMVPNWEEIARMLLLQNRDMRAMLLQAGNSYDEPEAKIDV